MQITKIASIAITAALISFTAAAAETETNVVDEVDIVLDDTAEEAGKAPKVNRTTDGYIDVNCENAMISEVLQQFRLATQMNIINGDSTNLTRRVSVSLKHVLWTEALQAILEMADFQMTERHGMWFVSEKSPEEALNATRYYVLKHASAVDLADLFNGVSMKTSYEERNSIRSSSINRGAENGASKSEGDPTEHSALAGRAKATAFPNTNTLVLSGEAKKLDECERIIQELDRPITQVYIEARFIELSTQAMHKLGVQWDKLSSWGATVKNVKAGYETNNGQVADYGSRLTQRTVNKNSTSTLNNTDSNTSTASSDGTSSANASKNGNDSSNTTDSENSTFTGLVPSAIAEAAGAGASAASMGWASASTFSGQISADEFGLAISAFEQLEEGKLFSNPRIIVANGKEARVDMTTKEPNVEVKSSRSGSDGQSLDISTKLETIPGNDRNLFAGEAFFSYGISLTVKPRVSSTGLISVEVVPTISEKDSDKSIAGAGSDAVYTTYPIINVKTINTEFTMKDGATAVIGGLTQTKEADVDSGIPYLRKIPWIGPKLFGWKSREKVQTEILVCVTVGIANPETLRKDAGLPLNAILGREYVEGRKLEPGERPNAVKQMTSIDTRSIEEIREDPYRIKEDAEAKAADSSVDLEEEDADLEDDTPENTGK